MRAFKGPRTSLGALAVGGVAALASAFACTGSGSGGSNGQGAAGSVYVIDATGKLFAFSDKGTSQGSVALPSPIGALNGGGIGVASGQLYVTIGQPTDAVRAYTLALAPVTLPSGAFHPLAVPRGIAYDPQDDRFFVGNGASGGTPVFSATGAKAAASGGFPGSYGMSGVAYDPDDGTLWVANYVGAPSATPPTYGVSEYTASGDAAQTFDYGTQFAPPSTVEEPYAITVCPRSATGGTTLVVVGFTNVEKTGTPSVQPYTTSGAPVGPALTGGLAGPYALSCDAAGNVYVADKKGLFRDKVTSGGFTGQSATRVSPGFSGLTPPIYGVLASSGQGGAGSDGGAANDGAPDATVDAAGDGAPDAAGDGARDAAGDADDASDAGCTLTTAGADGGAVTIGAGEECELPSQVTASMTIAPSPCGVYDAPGGLFVSGQGTVLTIEPGVTIAFGADQPLLVTGGAGIVVGGGGSGACAPVVFTSDARKPSAGAWAGVLLQTPAAGSSVSNLVVEYGGSTTATIYGNTGYASFGLDGTNGDFTLKLAGVTLARNGSVPIVFLGNHTGPAAGSALTIPDWPTGADSLAICPDAAGMLSNVTLSGPTGTVHLTTPGDEYATIDTPQTWPSIMPRSYTLAEPPGPYVIDPSGDVGDHSIESVLTIAAPNTLRVGSNFTLEVDPAETGAGALVAIGSITFTSLAGAAPWNGIEFHYPGWKASTMSGVAFESVGPYQDEGCYKGQGPPTGAILLFNSESVCESAPPFTNLTFPKLTADYGILPWYVKTGDLPAFQASNPGAKVYTCPFQCK